MCGSFCSMRRKPQTPRGRRPESYAGHSSALLEEPLELWRLDHDAALAIRYWGEPVVQQIAARVDL